MVGVLGRGDGRLRRVASAAAGTASILDPPPADSTVSWPRLDRPNSHGPAVIAVVLGGEAGEGRSVPFVPLPVAVTFDGESASSRIGWPSWSPFPLTSNWI